MKRSLLILLLVAISAAQKMPKFQWSQGELEQPELSLAAHKGFTKPNRDAILHVLFNKFDKNSTPPNSEQRAEQVHVKLVDLNGDKFPEVIVELVGDYCSPTGNCPWVVLQKTGQSYKVILEKGAVQSFMLQKTLSSSYRDVVLGMHGSASEQGLFVYQFRGKRYIRTHCYIASLSYVDENGEVHELDEARITPCKK